MKTITDITVQKKDKNRANIILDGSYYCALNIETVVKHNLKKGIMIDEKLLDDYQLESEKSNAYNMVLKLISTRYKTQKEIYVYLQEKGYLPVVIFYVINKLNEYHFIDDEKYAESYVAHKIQKDGGLKIKQELLKKGVSEDIIDRVLEKQSGQEDVIKTLAEKYMKNKEDTKENYIKLFRYLQNKGFEYEHIKSAIKGDE